MRFSPNDIRQAQFAVKTFRGFDPHQVDEFLDGVAEDYEAVLKEATLLKEQLAAQEARARGIVEREKSLQDTLVTTQRLAGEMKAAAKREGELIVREAELRGEKLVEEARGEEAKIRSQIQSLRRMRRQLVEELTATLERYRRVMTSELESLPDSGDVS